MTVDFPVFSFETPTHQTVLEMPGTKDCVLNSVALIWTLWVVDLSFGRIVRAVARITSSAIVSPFVRVTSYRPVTKCPLPLFRELRVRPTGILVYDDR